MDGADVRRADRPLGITSIILVILQPVMVGTWCSLCLVTALFMLLMIPLAVDEVVAMGGFMATVRRQGKPFWVNFWKGGSPWADPWQHQHESMGGEDDESVDFHATIREIATTSVRGVTVPLSLLASALIGFWLMGAPPALAADGWAASSDFLVGPLMAVVAVSTWAEVIRPFRYVNIALGAWLLVAPFVLNGATTTSTLNDVVAGLTLIVLSLPRGPVSEDYGRWTLRVR